MQTGSETAPPWRHLATAHLTMPEDVEEEREELAPELGTVAGAPVDGTVVEVAQQPLQDGTSRHVVGGLHAPAPRVARPRHAYNQDRHGGRGLTTER